MDKKEFKVLLVEDDDVIRDVYQHYFEKDNFSVYVATTGPDAISYSENQTFDIILLDVIIPGYDGFTVLRKLKENEKTASIPVMVLTNLDDDKYLQRALKLGANEYMIKANSTPSEILQHMKILLKSKS